MKMTKKQRRLVNKLTFPIVALLMMTTMMALAGSRHTTAPIQISSPSP